MSPENPTVAFYLRVSTKDQTTENQRQQLKKWAECLGWSNSIEFEDTMSGAISGRPAFEELTKTVVRKEVDVVMAWSIDRLGRNVQDLLELSNIASTNKVRLMFHREGVDTSNASGKMYFTIMAALAEFERERIRERVMAGLERARSEGKVLGRPKSYNPDTAEVVHSMKSCGTTITKIAKTLSIPRQTVYRILEQPNLANV